MKTFITLNIFSQVAKFKKQVCFFSLLFKAFFHILCFFFRVDISVMFKVAPVGEEPFWEWPPAGTVQQLLGVAQAEPWALLWPWATDIKQARFTVLPNAQTLRVLPHPYSCSESELLHCTSEGNINNLFWPNFLIKIMS